MIKYVLLLVPAFLFAFSSIELKPVDKPDSVTFNVKNFGINTKGEFKGLKGSIKWDPADPSHSSFDVSVDVNSINTGIEMRDRDLMEDTWFNTSRFSTISFKSTDVSANTVTGNLTIKGITKQITFPFVVSEQGMGYEFEGKFSLNRKDFGIGGSSFTLSDNVDVQLKVKVVE